MFSLLLSHTSFLLMNGISNLELDNCVRVTNPTSDKFVVRISFVMGFCRVIYLMVLELIPISLGDKYNMLYDSIERQC
jgi:hypothetical protein